MITNFIASSPLFQILATRSPPLLSSFPLLFPSPYFSSPPILQTSFPSVLFNSLLFSPLHSIFSSQIFSVIILTTNKVPTSKLPSNVLFIFNHATTRFLHHTIFINLHQQDRKLEIRNLQILTLYTL